MNQPDLPFHQCHPTPPEDKTILRTWLNAHGWQTRHQLAAGLGWTERRIRETAEALGADIVRGQAGFKLTADLTREDLSHAQQARDAALSQGKRMIRYALSLGRRLHAIIK